MVVIAVLVALPVLLVVAVLFLTARATSEDWAETLVAFGSMLLVWGVGLAFVSALIGLVLWIALS